MRAFCGVYSETPARSAISRGESRTAVAVRIRTPEQATREARFVGVRFKKDAVLALVACAIGAAVLVYHGPGRAFVRGYVGDVAVTMLVFALLGVTRWSLRTRAVVTMAIALAIELRQIAWAGGLVLGNVFDPWDVVAYAVGVVVAVAYHCAHVGRRRAVPGQ